MTTDHGQTPNRVTLPIGQMYHVAVDNDVPYKIYGNMQDDGTMRGPSTTQEAGPNVPGQGGGARRIRRRTRAAAGGRGSTTWAAANRGFTLPDLTDTNIVWASCYGNEVTRYDAQDEDGALGEPVAAHAGFRSPTRPSIAATGRRRWRSIRSTTTRFTTAARWFCAPPTAA